MINLAHAQTAAAPVADAAAGPFGAFSQFVPILLIVFVFYFLLIRPQQKQQKLQKKMIDEVKRGDEVVMTSGIYGKLTEVKDDTIQVQVANNVILKFQRNMIQSVKGYEAAKAK